MFIDRHLDPEHEVGALTERERADLVFGIKVSIDDSSGRLKAGMPVQVDLPLQP